jgi:SAM-dependent methyltransferase
MRVRHCQPVSAVSFLGTLLLLLVLPSATRLRWGVGAFSGVTPPPRNFVQAVKERTQAVPTSNPSADPDATSVSGANYAHVLQGLNALYPPTELESRNALSRKDGYWPYINEGKEPPECFTYGEFDFFLFAQLLDRTHQLWIEHHEEDASRLDWRDKIFVDIGSGAGRLVAAAAALHPSWTTCRGIELLPSIHESAVATLQECRDDDGSYALAVTSNLTLPIAPIDLACGSFADPYTHFGDADVIFMFTSALNPTLLCELSLAVGRQCRPGTLVLTTDYALNLEGEVPPVEGDNRFSSGSFRLEIVDQIDGWCWCTGGQTTAYIHRVVKAVHPEGLPHALDRPVPSVQDVAFQVAMQRERGELTDTDRFLRGVANNVRFQGLPEGFVPRRYQEN